METPFMRLLRQSFFRFLLFWHLHPRAVTFEVRATFPGPVLLIKTDSLLLLVGFLAQEEGAPVIDVTVPAPTVNLRCQCCG